MIFIVDKSMKHQPLSAHLCMFNFLLTYCMREINNYTFCAMRPYLPGKTRLLTVPVDKNVKQKVLLYYCTVPLSHTVLNFVLKERY